MQQQRRVAAIFVSERSHLRRDVETVQLGHVGELRSGSRLSHAGTDGESDEVCGADGESDDVRAYEGGLWICDSDGGCGFVFVFVIIGQWGEQWKQQQRQQQQQQQPSDDRAWSQSQGGAKSPHATVVAAAAGTAAVVGASYIAYQHHNKDDTSYQNEFQKLDANNSGQLERWELEQTFGKYLPKKIVDAAMKMADKDKDGTVSVDEYVAMRRRMVAMGFAAAAAAAAAGISYVAYQHHNKNNEHEWQLPHSQPHRQQHPNNQFGSQHPSGNNAASNSSYQNEFDKLDSDNSGYLERAELERLLGKFLPKRVIDAAMGAADADGDGTISVSEYVAIRQRVGGKIPGLS